MTQLSFLDYQLRTDDTALYPEAGLGTTPALAYAALGLGEAGEIQNQVKKILRDDAGGITPERRAAIKAELGDLLWYVARVATELDLNLTGVAQANLDKLESRKARGVIHGSGDTR